MSQQGIRGFYQLTQTIKDQLLADINVNTVTTGDIYDVNLNKQDIFPLSHIIVNNVLQQEQTLTFNISIIAMDIVDQSKSVTTDKFKGNNNEQDILNTQLSVLTLLVQKLRMGALHQEMYQVEGNATLTPFNDRFENELAGWAADFEVLIYNDIYIC